MRPTGSGIQQSNWVTVAVCTPWTDNLAAAASPWRVGRRRASSTIPNLKRFMGRGVTVEGTEGREGRRMMVTGQYTLVIFGVEAAIFPSPSTFKK
jgi:hypothetical protein